MGCWAKYWIYVCGGMFIMVSFAGKLVGYKIVYMLLFLICLCLYQVGTGSRSNGPVPPGVSSLTLILIQNYVPVEPQYISSFLLLEF